MAGELTTKADPLNTVRGLLEKNQKQFEMALPSHINAAHMIRVALTTINRTPKLLACTPLSLCSAVMQAAELGLELSGPLGQAYLIPYWNSHTKSNEAQFQIGYKGIKDLAFRTGQVASYPARVVHEKDPFDINYGTNQFIHHKPYVGAGDPGKIIGVYAVVNFKGGGEDFEFWTYDQVEEHRKRYSKYSDKPDSVWQNNWPAMAKKTLMIQVGKRCPMSVEWQHAVGLTELSEAGQPQPLYTGLENTIEATQLRLDQLKEQVGAGEPEQERRREPGEEG